VTSHYRNEWKEHARETLKEIWGIDGRNLDPPPIPGEKDQRIADAVQQLIKDDFFLESEPNEQVCP
jgi:hypothetical protein